MAFDFNLGAVTGSLVDALGIRASENIAAAQAQAAVAAEDRAYAQLQTSRAYLQENQRSLLILAAAAVILFALVWRSGKG